MQERLSSIKCPWCKKHVNIVLPADLFREVDSTEKDIPVICKHGASDHVLYLYIDRDFNVLRARATIVLHEDHRGKPGIGEILTNCKLCDDNIFIPVPKKHVSENELPVVRVTYIHGDPPHAIQVHLDHDLQVRRRRFASIILE